MNRGIELGLIPEHEYPGYRYDVIFNAYKWDPQVEDNNTVSRHVLLMEKETADKLETWAEQLARETMLMEEAVIKNMDLAKDLGLPKKIYKALDKLKAYERCKNIRLMRFDFHPIETVTGWAVSEVNSDVPGGLAEASVLPGFANKYFNGYKPGVSTAEKLFEAFEAKIKKSGVMAFVHATAYADDRQVMQFLGDYFSERGNAAVFAAPDHLRWANKKARIDGLDIDGIMRFFPLEWLVNLPGKNWRGYYDCELPSCNHPVAIFAQSKRLPMIWDKLEVPAQAWKELLPETSSLKLIKEQDIKNNDWIYKPAFGRVGEGIYIKGASAEKELPRIEKAARRDSAYWVAQRKFNSQPLPGDYHLCVGVFTVDGKRAGFYGRLSPYPLIDSKARDIPVLIRE